MPDDKTKRHPLDGKRIDVNDPKEVANWCNILGCTPAHLEQVVKIIGTSARDVRDYFEKDKRKKTL